MPARVSPPAPPVSHHAGYAAVCDRCRRTSCQLSQRQSTRIALEKVKTRELSPLECLPFSCCAGPLAIPQSAWLTILKLTSWACGTNLSTLERKRARSHQNGAPE